MSEFRWTIWLRLLKDGCKVVTKMLERSWSERLPCLLSLEGVVGVLPFSQALRRPSTMSFIGYPLLLNWATFSRAWIIKSSSRVQMRLNLRNWPSGIPLLQCVGWAESKWRKLLASVGLLKTLVKSMFFWGSLCTQVSKKDTWVLEMVEVKKKKVISCFSLE